MRTESVHNNLVTRDINSFIFQNQCIYFTSRFACIASQRLLDKRGERHSDSIKVDDEGLATGEDGRKHIQTYPYVKGDPRTTYEKLEKYLSDFLL